MQQTLDFVPPHPGGAARCRSGDRRAAGQEPSKQNRDLLLVCSALPALGSAGGFLCSPCPGNSLPSPGSDRAAAAGVGVSVAPELLTVPRALLPEFPARGAHPGCHTFQRGFLAFALTLLTRFIGIMPLKPEQMFQCELCNLCRG